MESGGICTVNKRLFTLFLCCGLSPVTAAMADTPIIDMHVHARNAVQSGPDHQENLALLEAYQAEADENNVVLFIASGAETFVKTWKAHFGPRMLAGAAMPCINGRTQFEKETDGRMPCFEHADSRLCGGQLAG